MFLRQSTASQEVSLGYFLDTTDGNTQETGLTIANTDIKIRKGGGTTLTNKNSGNATHISNGIYSAVLDATDTNTLGDLVIYCHPTGALATKIEYTVLPAASYDALIVNGLNDLSAAQVNAEVDTGLSDYAGPTNSQMEARTVASSTYATASALSTVDGIVDSILVDTNELQGNQGDWATATGFATAANLATVDGIVDAILADTNELQGNQGDWATATGYATATNLATVDGIVDSILADTNELQGNQGDWATATGYATSSALATVDSNVDAITSAVATIDSVVEATSSALATVDSNVDAILVDTGNTLPGSIAGLNNISVADILASGDIDGFTIEQASKLILAALAGKVSGAGTTTITIKAADDSKPRITATVDTIGNRSSITTDVSG
jgi:hypothetical protein